VRDERLVDALRAHLPSFGLNGESEITVCESLKELSTAKYFFEALWHFSNEGVPYGESWAAWLDEKRAELAFSSAFCAVGPLE